MGSGRGIDAVHLNWWDVHDPAIDCHRAPTNGNDMDLLRKSSGYRRLDASVLATGVKLGTGYVRGRFFRLRNDPPPQCGAPPGRERRDTATDPAGAARSILPVAAS